MSSISTKKEGFYGWVSLSAVALLFFLLNGGVLYSFGAFLPSICNAFGWKRGDVSAALTLLLMVGTFTSIGAGFFVARYGPRRAIVGGSLVIAVGMLLLSFLSKQWHFFVAYGILGLGMGFGGQVAVTTVASNWFVKKLPLAMSVLVTSAGLGGLLLVPLVMAVINTMGWRSAYQLLCGLIFIFGAVAAGAFVRNKPEDFGQVPDGVASPGSGQEASHRRTGTNYVTPVDFTVKEAMGTVAFWMLILFGDAALFMMNLLSSHQIAFLMGLGIGSETAALATGLMTGLSVVGTLGMGFLALKYNINRLTLVSACLMVVSAILVLLTESAAMGFAYSIVFGIGFGAAMVAIMSFWPAYFGRTNYAKIVGISGIFRIIGGIGAPVAGFLFDATKSYTLAHAITLAVAVLGVISVLILRSPLHPSLKGEGKTS
jgi:MFS family permease